MHQFSGLVQIEDGANNATILLDGDSGDVTVGGNGQDGLLVVANGANAARVSIDGQTGTITVTAATGETLVTIDGQEGDTAVVRQLGGVAREVLRFDASEAALTLGAEGSAGDVVVRDASGGDAVLIDGASAALTVGAGGNGADLVARDSGSRDVLQFTADNAALYIGANGNEGDIIVRDGAGREIFHVDGDTAALYVGASGNEGDIIVRDGSAREVFHMDGNSAALYVGADGNEGDIIVRDGSGREVFHVDGQFALVDVGAAGNEGDIRVWDDAGNVRIHLDGGAGDIKLFGADCAEHFEIGDTDVAQGSVVVIGDDGALRQSGFAYDRRVAGVISGAGGLRPGIVLGRDPNSSAGTPVALAGRVHCRVDADLGPIAVGDLLTTSDTPGHAMKADDQERAFGAVIGKALAPLRSGRDLIPILVALQ